MNLPFSILFLSTFILSSLTNAQSICGITANKDLIRISSNGCTFGLVLSGNNWDPNPGAFFTDIAYEQGVLYGAGSSNICIIHPENGHLEWVNMGGGFDLNGLTGDQNGNLYLAGPDIGRFNISSGVLEPIGSLAPYHISGDVEYVNESLYISASDTNGNGFLLKAEINPFSYSVIGSIPNDSYGLTKSNELDAGHLYLSSYNTLYSLDINNASMTMVCSSIPGIPGIYGLTLGPEDLGAAENGVERTKISQDPVAQTLSIRTFDKKIRECTIYNELGQEIVNVDLKDESVLIGTSAYPEGVYLIRFNDGYTLKFAIVK